jgi:hypothetical protein
LILLRSQSDTEETDISLEKGEIMGRGFCRGIRLLSTYVSIGVCIGTLVASAQSDGSGIPGNIDWMAQPSNCGAPSEWKYKWQVMQYQYCCYLPPNASHWVNRSNRSANEVVAWAVLAGVRHHDKYLAVAWLALGQAHDPNAEQEILDHKRVAWEYLASNYIAAWQNHDPSEQNLGPGEAFKVGVTYHASDLDGCVENDAISDIDIPEGLAATVCDDDSGDPNKGAGCMTFYAGSHFVGRLNDKISYVRVFRFFGVQ